MWELALLVDAENLYIREGPAPRAYTGVISCAGLLRWLLVEPGEGGIVIIG